MVLDALQVQTIILPQLGLKQGVRLFLHKLGEKELAMSEIVELVMA